MEEALDLSSDRILNDDDDDDDDDMNIKIFSCCSLFPFWSGEGLISTAISFLENLIR